jgi:hypothetical protein
MGVESAVMQVMDCAALYNHKAASRKLNSFAPQTVISERTLILFFKY